MLTLPTAVSHRTRWSTMPDVILFNPPKIRLLSRVVSPNRILYWSAWDPFVPVSSPKSIRRWESSEGREQLFDQCSGSHCAWIKNKRTCYQNQTCLAANCLCKGEVCNHPAHIVHNWTCSSSVTAPPPSNPGSCFQIIRKDHNKG